jgi:holo-[acyl-carrier protein] synthase
LTRSPKTYVGVDIIEIQRIERAAKHWKNLFLDRIYTRTELEYHQNRFQSLAACFAGKEAVIKALGPDLHGLKWRDIEISLDNHGSPSVQLYGQAYKKAKEKGITEFSLSLSHSRELAIAFVIGNVE